MGKKQHRNGYCNCQSGKTYKECCGKDAPIKANTLTYIGEDSKHINQHEKLLMNHTGYHPNYYIRPVRSKAPIIYILLDESNLSEQYSMSGIVFEKENVGNLNNAKMEMTKLAEFYKVDYFHFTDIFGRNKIFNDSTFSFIDSYSSIVSSLNLMPFSICKSKNEVLMLHGQPEMSEKEIFISLQWQLMFKILIYLVWKYGNELIIHMVREQENITQEKAQLHYLNARDIQEKFPFAYISFYKYYDIFYKTEIFNSSISDLVAYVSTGLADKNSKGISRKKTINDYYKPLLLLSKTFADIKFIDIDNLGDYKSELKDREAFRNNEK